MKLHHIHLVVVALIATDLQAQDAKPPRGHRPPPVSPLLVCFDQDRDGVISAVELENASNSLGKLDQNNDGQITRDELRPPPPRDDGGGPQNPPAGKLPPPPVIAALDRDRDGTISSEEMKAAPESLKEVDTNGDGELSPEELHPHGPPPPPRDGPPHAEGEPAAE